MEREAQHRILIIDDNPAIHEDFRKILESRNAADDQFLAAKEDLFGDTAGAISPQQFRLDSAFQGQEGLACVQKACQAGDPYSLAFVDIRMPPGWDGIETIARLWSVDPKIQIVICSAYADYSWEQIIERLGNSDNFVILKKPFDNIEVIQLAHALSTKRDLAEELESRLNNLDRLVLEKTRELHAANDQLHLEIRERVLTEQALRRSEEQFSAAFRNSPLPIALQNLETRRFLEVNEKFLQMTGYTRAELLAQNDPAPELWSADGQSPDLWEMLRRGDRVHEWSCNIRTKTGELHPARLFAELLRLGSEPLVLSITEDISDQVRMESQLRQAHKMEAIGQMAAGIAHDFNNHLTLILGHLSLILDSKSFEPAVENSIRQAFRAGEKAGMLTRQLLAFSRKQVMERRPIDLSALFCELQSMLERVIGEQIQVSCEAAPNLPLVFADACNLEQVILNLAVNARDAMPNGGKLAISAHPVLVDAHSAHQHPDAVTGSFICVKVSDTGCGMDEITRHKAFDPFFTTKATGKGTGMGLATVYGIVKQHQGWIILDSQPGLGTTFSIFLPIAASEQNRCQPPEPGPSPILSSAGHETILVVEDEDLIGEFVQSVLSAQGYKTLVARDGVEALEVWKERGHEIDLLLTDVVMPNGISGKDLAQRLSAENPRLKVVFTSGYGLDVLGLDPKIGEGNFLLQKPYQPDLLLETIRKCLDSDDAEGHRVVNNRWSQLSMA